LSTFSKPLPITKSALILAGRGVPALEGMLLHNSFSHKRLE
jgi:hypothetical protein